MTTLAVQCYAPGLVVFSLLKVLIPVFYAQQDMKTPVKIGLACTALNVALMLILMWPMKHAGIALATVISSGVQVVIDGCSRAPAHWFARLAQHFRRRGPDGGGICRHGAGGALGIS